MKTLSQSFGRSLLPVVDGRGLRVLKAFHKKYPDETLLDASEECVIFAEDQRTYHIYAWETPQGAVVCKSTATTYEPKVIVFDSGWVSTFKLALDAVKAFAAKDGRSA